MSKDFTKRLFTNACLYDIKGIYKRVNKLQKAYRYPAIFNYAEDGITVTFPDLFGCISCAKDEEKAFFMAKDALSGHMKVIEEYENNIPVPTELNKVRCNKNQKVIIIQVDMQKGRNK